MNLFRRALARLVFLLVGIAMTFSPVWSADDWHTEFAEVCSRTDIAMTLSIEELQELTARCDQLQQTIEQLSGAERKVSLRRLEMCRNLYQFVLESKQNEHGG